MNKPNIALVDGDILRYQLGAVLSKGSTITIQGNTIDVPLPKDTVTARVTEFIDELLTSTGASSLKVYLSEGRNFRYSRATLQPYKGNRAGFVKPYHWGTVGDVLRSRYTCITCEEFEADDHLSADQDSIGGTTVICSRDKDLRIRAGWHYSWSAGTRCPEKPLYWITETQGIRWFYTQLLTGDSTDNIIGCGIKKPTSNGKLRRNGVGPKKAEEILSALDNEKDMFKAVAYQYQAVYGDDWTNAMKENGSLLWMCDEFTPWEELPKVKELFNEFQDSNWQ